MPVVTVAIMTIYKKIYFHCRTLSLSITGSLYICFDEHATDALLDVIEQTKDGTESFGTLVWGEMIKYFELSTLLWE